MKDKQDRLLQDLIRNPGYEAFRAELWQTTMGEVRRRRWERTRNRYLAVAACLFLSGLLFTWWEWQPRGGVRRPNAVAVVRSQPLREAQIVRTSAGRIDVVATQPWEYPSMPLAPSPLGIVQTEFKPGAVLRLSDQELLELFRGHPTALVSLDGGGEQLVFLDAADEAQFMVKPDGR
jgi:hypothetical protein